MTHLSRRQFMMAAGGLLAAAARPRFSGKFGLELYSLRREAQKDLPGTLAMIRKFGVTDVEMGDLYGRSAQEFRSLLDKAGLKASSMMAAHARLAGDIQAVARNARTIGANYVVCSTI